MPTRNPARLVAPLLIALALLAAACGGGGDDDEAVTVDTSGADRFTIWAPTLLKKPLESVISKFKNLEDPEGTIEIEVVYGEGGELNDRLLVGERPDVYLGSANEIGKLTREGTLPDNHVDFGADPIQLVVAAGNPKQIVDVSVFGLDPTTTTALCVPNAACGRAARATLSNAREAATPDSVQPDSRTIVRMIENGSVDASLLYRSETVRARQQGVVQIINLPSTVGTEVGMQFAIVRPGPAVDRFMALAGDTKRNWKIMAQAGLAPLPGDPQ